MSLHFKAGQAQPFPHSSTSSCLAGKKNMISTLSMILGFFFIYLFPLFNPSDIDLLPLNPIGCGGGGKGNSPKKKSCQFFFNFLKYVNGRLGTTFCSQITFSVVGRGLRWSKLPQFHKGGPCREQQEGEITNQNRCQVIHVAHNFLVIFLLKHLGLGEI